MAGNAKKRALRSKRLPKEIKAMVDGGVNLLSIIIALVAAICALATKLGKSDAEAAAVIHRLSTPAGKETLAKMAEVAFGVADKVATVAKQVVGGFVTTYDQALGLVALIERAVGEANHANIDRDITPSRFPLNGTGARSVRLAVEPLLDGESREQATKRLAGHTFGNTGDLAGFLHDHPDEVEKWVSVAAVSEDSRWAYSDGNVCVPCAGVGGASRDFDLYGFRHPLDSYYGVLVVLGE